MTVETRLRGRRRGKLSCLCYDCTSVCYTWHVFPGSKGSMVHHDGCWSVFYFGVLAYEEA